MSGPERPQPKPKEKEVARMPAGTWWGVGRYKGRKPFTTVGYRQRLGKGFPNNWYPFGCGNSLHHGLDVGGGRSHAHKMPIYAWGRCVIRVNSYDPGGYARFVQVFFPDVNWSLTLGHLLNGSTYPVGTWFRRGQYIARIGTRKDGILNSHVHYRAAPGDWRRAIPPCSDRNPLILWNKLK